MPQLDKFSFIAQLVWFWTVFFLVFVFFAQSVLPTIGRTLKIRERLLSSAEIKADDLSSLEDINKEILEIYASAGEANSTAVKKLMKDLTFSVKAVDLVLSESEEIKNTFKEEISFLKGQELAANEIHKQQ